MSSQDDNANMFAHVLPVYNPVLMAERMPKADYQHGIYNCGIGANGDARKGIVRSCTINQRHRLGRKAMHSKEYGSALYEVDFDQDWRVQAYQRIKIPDIIHDVRVSNYIPVPKDCFGTETIFGVGCKRVATSQGVTYKPVAMVKTNDAWVCADVPQLSTMRGSQKNWVHLPSDDAGVHYDAGYIEEHRQRGIVTVSPKGAVRLQTHVSRTSKGRKLRGGTNFIHLNPTELLICYHVVDDMGDNVRNYRSVFCILEAGYPFAIKASTPPLKFQSSSLENMVQFPMGLVRDGDRLMVSYGLADADNVIGEIREQDVMNLMS